MASSFILHVRVSSSSGTTAVGSGITLPAVVPIGLPVDDDPITWRQFPSSWLHCCMPVMSFHAICQTSTVYGLETLKMDHIQQTVIYGTTKECKD